MSMESSCLRISNLSICCNERYLVELFHDIGAVIDAEIKHTLKDENVFRCCFATFATIVEAKNGMIKNGLMVLGRKIRVDYGYQISLTVEYAELSVHFHSKQVETMVYEQTIRQLFSLFGCEVEDVEIWEFSINAESKSHSGRGLVRYPLTRAGVLACKRAVDHLSHARINEVVYRCEMSANLINTLRIKADLDAFYMPQWLSTSTDPIGVDVGFELQYMPLKCYQYISSCCKSNDGKTISVVNSAERRDPRSNDPQEISPESLQVSRLSTSQQQQQQRQQWNQQQTVVAASAKKQQIESRLIGKLQPNMPTYLFSNARYNPTSHKKKPDHLTAIDPKIAATAAKIAVAASAALIEFTMSSAGGGVGLSQMSNSHTNNPVSLLNQHLPPMQAAPRQQQSHHQHPQHQSSPPPPQLRVVVAPPSVRQHNYQKELFESIDLALLTPAVLSPPPLSNSDSRRSAGQSTKEYDFSQQW